MAATYDLTIDAGADFVLRVGWVGELGVPIELETYSFAAQIREDYGSSSAMSFDVAIAGDQIELAADHEMTGALDFQFGVWDLEATLTDTGYVTRLLQGAVEVSREVTR